MTENSNSGSTIDVLSHESLTALIKVSEVLTSILEGDTIIYNSAEYQRG